MYNIYYRVAKPRLYVTKLRLINIFMAYLQKILCPNKAVHKDHDKIFIIIRPGRAWAKTKSWIHCDHPKCKKWMELTFSDMGFPTLKVMPAGVNFDVTRVPSIVIEDKNAHDN